jgi:hypothetical protein
MKRSFQKTDANVALEIELLRAHSPRTLNLEEREIDEKSCAINLATYHKIGSLSSAKVNC